MARGSLLKDRLREALDKAIDAQRLKNQSELADRVGISRASVSAWFTGETKALEGRLEQIATVRPAAQPGRGAAIARSASAGARQAMPIYNPFPKPLICTSSKRGTLVDTYCR